MKTRVSLKYFVTAYLSIYFSGFNLPQTPLYAISLAILGTVMPFTVFLSKI